MTVVGQEVDRLRIPLGLVRPSVPVCRADQGLCEEGPVKLGLGSDPSRHLERLQLCAACVGVEQGLAASGRGVTGDRCEPVSTEGCDGGREGVRIPESPQSRTGKAVVAISPVLWMTLQTSAHREHSWEFFFCF